MVNACFDFPGTPTWNVILKRRYARAAGQKNSNDVWDQERINAALRTGWFAKASRLHFYPVQCSRHSLRAFREHSSTERQQWQAWSGQKAKDDPGFD
jgi:hypothetical protein